MEEVIAIPNSELKPRIEKLDKFMDLDICLRSIQREGLERFVILLWHEILTQESSSYLITFAREVIFGQSKL